jgi:tRNA (cytidine32/uridine32-2'-O)-methyltransferase
MTLPIRIVLVETSLPRNIGSAARAMKNMGLAELWLVRPQQFPHAEATALASSAADVLVRARVVDAIGAAIADCGLVLGTSARPRNANWTVLDPRAAAARCVTVATGRPVAILFGNERNGLANEDLALCHALVSIPANPEYESLNLAQAVQIVAYEIRIAQGAVPRMLPRAVPPATAGQVERLHEHLAEVLGEIGFTDARNAPHVLARLQRLLGRAAPDEEEVQVLRGILTAIQQSRRRGDGRP